MDEVIQILRRRIRDLGIRISETESDCEQRRYLVFAQLILSDLLNELMLKSTVEELKARNKKSEGEKSE